MFFLLLFLQPQKNKYSTNFNVASRDGRGSSCPDDETSDAVITRSCGFTCKFKF